MWELILKLRILTKKGGGGGLSTQQEKHGIAPNYSH